MIKIPRKGTDIYGNPIVNTYDEELQKEYVEIFVRLLRGLAECSGFDICHFRKGPNKDLSSKTSLSLGIGSQTPTTDHYKCSGHAKVRVNEVGEKGQELLEQFYKELHQLEAAQKSRGCPTWWLDFRIYGE